MSGLLAGSLMGCDNSSAPTPANGSAGGNNGGGTGGNTSSPSGSFTAAGTAVTATSPMAMLSGTALNITLTASTGSVSLVLPSVTGPGTFTMANGGFGGGYVVGTSVFGSTTGSVQFTTFDTAARKVSGTFSFDGTNQATAATISITNGTFSNVPIR